MMILMKSNRVTEREFSRIALEFYTITTAFEARTYSNNFANENEFLNIVEKFNDIWLRFCSHWNSFDHSINPNPFAFQNYLADPFHVKITNE